MNGAALDYYRAHRRTAAPFQARRADGLHELFVDAWVLHDRAVSDDVKLSRFDPSGYVDLTFRSGEALCALTPDDGFAASDFGDYTLYRWHRSATLPGGFTREDLSVRLIAVRSKLPEYTYPITPLDAYLLSSLVNPACRGVRRTGLALEGVPGTFGISGKPLILEGGFNVELGAGSDGEVRELDLGDPDTADPREATTITVDVAPGLGQGRFPFCEPEATIKTINRIGPDARGNFSLEGEGCLWAEARLDGGIDDPLRANTHYIGRVIENLLQLHQQCKACCDCRDYTGAYLGLKDLHGRAKVLADRLEAARVAYNELCALYAELKNKKETGLGVKLSLTARPDYHLALVAQVFNNSALTKGPVTVSFALSGPTMQYLAKSGYVEAEGYHHVQADPIASGGGWSFTFPSLRPAHYGVYTFQLRATGANRAGATARVTAQVGEALDQKSVLLLGPLTKG